MKPLSRVSKLAWPAEDGSVKRPSPREKLVKRTSLPRLWSLKSHSSQVRQHFVQILTGCGQTESSIPAVFKVSKNVHNKLLKERG